MLESVSFRSALLAVVWSVSLSVHAMADVPEQIDIPAGELVAALESLAKQSTVDLVYQPAQLKAFHTGGVKGQYTPEAAIRILLKGTLLELRTDPSGAMVIVLPNARSMSNNSAPGVRQEDRDGADAESPRDRLRLAQAAEAAPGGTTAIDGVRASDDRAPEEVVVTATKRPEVVRSIAGSVTALTGMQLEALGAQSYAGYLTLVPGVVFNAAVPGLSPVVIRGVATTNAFDQGQAATGYFINDVPLTDPTFILAIPDIDTFDVDNVAVLRGPQGTLFGSASLGGAVNYQVAKPDLNQFKVHVQGTFAGTDGGGTGGSGKLMVNVPLISDVLAVRGVYVYRNDAGYIDNIGVGRNNSNTTVTRGGRIEVTWKPSAATQLNYLFLKQDENTADRGDQQPTFAGTLNKNTYVLEPFDFTTTIHNLRLDQDLGFATLTATATYHEKTQSEFTDASSEGILPASSYPVVSSQTGTGRGLTFEARLVSPSGRPFEYLVGVFHDDTRDRFDSRFAAANQTAAIMGIENFYGLDPGVTAQITSADGTFEEDKTDFRGQESAVFGETSYHLNTQWKLALGGRLFDTRSDSHTDNFGLFELLGTAGSPTQILSGTQEQRGFAPKGSLTWTANGALMVYGLISKGFRFGGPNVQPQLPSSPEPQSYRSDSLINYELGTRTDWLDRRLQLDATVFYIDWSNIQLREHNALGAGFGVNAGRATNYGLESTFTWHMTRGLSFQSNLTYLNAQLAETFVPGGGRPDVPKGSTLPGASRWQVASTLGYQWFGVPLEPSFLVSQRFISRAPAQFDSPVTQGDYGLVNLRCAVHFKGITLTPFVENVGNVRGVSVADPIPPSPLRQFIVRPRTFGLTVDYRY
jgi:outer membrane receptor protein involved in Fe transport